MTTFFASCPRGLEELLARELEPFSKKTKPTRSGVYFDGGLDAAYQAVIWSRVANTVLYPLATFRASNEHELYRGVQSIHWHKQFDVSSTFRVDFISYKSNLDHTHYGALKTKDAIVDQFRDRDDERPSIDTDNPDIVINVYVARDEATVSIDLAGDSLHKRGYREAQVQAPIKENVAAAILYRAGWPEMAAEGKPLLDPMCGSGTFAIEAAMMAGDIAPGLYRDDHGFDAWLGHDPDLYRELWREAMDRGTAGESKIPPIFAYDIDPRAIEVARKNIEAAELDHVIELKQLSVSDLTPPTEEPGLIVTNPPYGERVGKDVLNLHHEFGEVLIERFRGWNATIITGSKELGFELGMRAEKINKMDNGPIECVLLNFEIEEQNVYRERR